MHIIQKSAALALLAVLGPLAIAAPPPVPAADPTLTTTPSSTATATSVSGTAATFTEPPVPVRPSHHHFLTKRADDKCYSGANFETSDFWGIENSFYSNNNWHWLDWNTCYPWKWGTVKVCVCNRNWFQTTSVHDRSIGDALSHVGNCCLTSLCSGGQSTISGDTGLLVDVTAIPSWDSC